MDGLQLLSMSQKTQGLQGLAPGQITPICPSPNGDYLEPWGAPTEKIHWGLLIILTNLEERKSGLSVEANFKSSWIHLPFLNKQHTIYPLPSSRSLMANPSGGNWQDERHAKSHLEVKGHSV